jgi:hypothetical protein
MREAHDRAQSKDPYTPSKSTPFERLSLWTHDSFVIFGGVNTAGDDIEAAYVPPSKAVAVVLRKVSSAFALIQSSR